MTFCFRTEFCVEAVWKPFERNLHPFERPGSSVKKICIPSNSSITCMVEMSSRSNGLLACLVKTSIRSNDLLTCLIKTSNRLNDLLTRLLKISNRSNDLLTRSLEQPSVQMTWVNQWTALIIRSGKKYQGIQAVVYTCLRIISWTMVCVLMCSCHLQKKALRSVC